MKDRKKIALVSNTSWSLYNFRIGIIRKLITEGYEVHVLAPKDEYSAKLTAAGAIYQPIQLINYSTNPYHELRLCYSLYRIYRKQQFDFIFHYTIKPNLYGTLAAYFAKTQSIAVTTGLGRMFQFNSKLVNAVILKLYRLAGRFSKETWFLNESDRETFIQQRIVQRHKTFLLPSEGINLNKFKPYDNSKRSPITRFLFAGRLLKEKGIFEFLKAAKIIKSKYPKVRFEVLGFIDDNNASSITRDELIQWQNAGIIKYLGSTEDVRPFIARADCVVFPSYYNEGISRILMEAASMAKPIITTDNVGCREVVSHMHNGLICQPKSVEDLIGAIQLFLSFNDNTKTSFGLNSRDIMREKYDERIILDIYQEKLVAFLEPKKITPIKIKTNTNE